MDRSVLLRPFPGDGEFVGATTAAAPPDGLVKVSIDGPPAVHKEELLYVPLLHFITERIGYVPLDEVLEEPYTGPVDKTAGRLLQVPVATGWPLCCVLAFRCDL
jgi:hypothetical protein